MFLPTLCGGTFLPMHFGSHTCGQFSTVFQLKYFFENLKYTSDAFLRICQYWYE